MHAIQQRPVAIKGEVVVRPTMHLALSYDHRAVTARRR
jgi:2-oxoglutarate dehydrogenase E2 component (dihydrolipoamide succinyltransferase)